jgi:hypothetical protein
LRIEIDQELGELMESVNCADLLLTWWKGTYELPCDVDVQGEQDAINNTDSIFWLRDTFLILTVPTTEIQHDDTECCERNEFESHSANTDTSTDLPGIRISAE